MSKPHFDKGDKVVVTARYSYDPEYAEGDIGTVIDFSWDYPNWEYRVQFLTGKLKGQDARVWDVDLKSACGKILDMTEWRKDQGMTQRDGQCGYLD